MIFKYVSTDLLRNPRRTLSTISGVLVGIALTCSILFFVDGLSASMTQQALAPLPIDMQRVITTLGSASELRLTYEPIQAVGNETRVNVHLEFKNIGDTLANEVVIRSALSPDLRFVPGSARVDNQPIGNKDQNPFFDDVTLAGWNLGEVSAGSLVTADYQVDTVHKAALTDENFGATFSTREIVSPIKANISKPLSLEDIAVSIRELKGVRFAEQLFFADLAPGSLSSTKQANEPVRIFGFDDSYAKVDPTIQILKGSKEQGAALISQEAAGKLSVGVGDTIQITLPDGSELSKRVSGIVDLTKSRALFSSRHGANLEVFLYVPNSVILDTDAFSKEVLKPFQRAASVGAEKIKSLPIQEVDIGLEREQLNAEPSVALKESKRINSSILTIAKGQGFVLDHVSNTLTVASGDARVAKQMFIFLGLPGVLLAAFLSSYAGIVLSSSQRREQAILRIRGASKKNLLSMLTLRVSFIAVIGATAGVALGFGTASLVVGYSTILRATTASLVFSAAVGTLSGLFVTGLALYLTGRRSINQEINKDRAKFVSLTPTWIRYRLDIIGSMLVLALTLIVVEFVGFKGTPGSVYVGRSVSISLWLLFLPMLAWFCGSLLGGRIIAWLLASPMLKFKRTQKSHFFLLSSLSIRRRSWSLAEASIIIGLIVAFGTSLAVFTSSYRLAKTADARYVLGADVKITPSPSSKNTYQSKTAQSLVSPDIDRVTPVVYGIHNVILRSDRTSEVANLAAIDPDSYLTVTPYEDSSFSDGSANVALNKLDTNSNSILLSVDMAAFLKVKQNDKIQVLLEKGAANQVEIELIVKGFYQNLPGFPDGAHALINIATLEKNLPAVPISFYLGHTKSSTDEFINSTATRLRSGIGAQDAVAIETRLSALAKDQSSLASLNIDGLLRIDSFHSLAMGALVIVIFVFGLLLSRRREYVLLKAQGMSSREIRALIGAEVVTVTFAGSLIGIPVGLSMAYYFINVLRPLFVLTPAFTIPYSSLAIISGSIMIAAIVTTIAASGLVNRLKATELLRDE